MAEIDFQSEMADLNVNSSHEILGDYLINESKQEKTLSKEEEIKEFRKLKGQPPEIILQKLISKYENDESLKTWIKNWRNFLSLHQFAENQSPVERMAIETIISNSNFTEENSFDIALSEINKSSEISTETKLDIQRQFKTTGINTVRAFDYTLKQEKKYKKNIEKKIQSRNSDIENLDDEIQKLNEELDKLPHDDPKRSELEVKIKEKSEQINTYKQELSVLNEAKSDKVQFMLRNNLLGVLNADGSRSVKIISESFSIQLPSNNLPLMGMKNLRSINVAFPFLVLRSLNISNEIFTPNLDDGGMPTKSQRDMAHFILSSLGIDDSRILSEKEIAQLKTDLTHLTDTQSAKTGRECLIELGIYNLSSQNVDMKQLKKALSFIRDNIERNWEYKDLKSNLDTN